MGNMGIGHQIVFLSHFGDAAAGFRAPVYSDKFPDDGAPADGQITFLSMELQILGGAADGGILKNLAVFADGNIVFDGGIGADGGTGPDAHVGVDNGIRTDGYPGINFSGWIDDSGRMNHGCSGF